MQTQNQPVANTIQIQILANSNPERVQIPCRVEFQVQMYW